MEIQELVLKQREYFATGVTHSVDFRLAMLKKLYSTIQKYEKDITDALKADLGKSQFEGYMCEVGLTLTEISYMIKHAPRFSKKTYVKTNLEQFPARSYTQAVPLGNVLIMSPWNYPFLLTMEPLVDALAAGNTAIVKPSAYSPATSAVVEKILGECFASEYVAVVTGGRKENAALLEQKFDFIFFTGSQNVGKEVLRRAAEYLTPAVLELGGKSPCIVEESADIKVAARRIVFGKYLNCGQTCVAPDFVLCQSSVKEAFVKAVCEEIKLQFGEDPLQNPDYGKIVNSKHFERVSGLIDPAKVVWGGKMEPEALRIAPTVMDRVTFEDAVMQEEIFGPIMPIISFDRVEELYELLGKREKPLAFYIFSENQRIIDELTTRLPFGGGCVNDAVIHLATSEMPFGGVGESGMGGYHGRVGFETFSHRKSMVHKKTWLDLPMRYQPYTNEKYKQMVKHIMK